MEIFNSTTEKEFIYQSYLLHKKKIKIESWITCFMFPVHPKMLNWLYKLGRDLRLLELDFEQFSRIMNNVDNSWFNGKFWRRYKYNPKVRYKYSEENYRVLKGFTQTGIPKKIISESEIRKKEKRSRRYDKHKHCCYMNDHWKKSWKFASKRKHRAFEREVIHTGNFDLFHARTYQNIENPWNWD